MLAALIGGPLAARLTGHSPIAQYPNALHSDGLPIGFMSRTLNATGTATNPHGSLFILGADQLGRDQLVRVRYGARISLLVATSATALALIIGVSLGLLARLPCRDQDPRRAGPDPRRHPGPLISAIRK